jgi:hypothetical protein
MATTKTEEKDPVTSCLAVIGGAFLIIPLMVAIEIYYGFILRTIYAWLIVPTYHVAPLTIPQAIGVALVVSFLTKTPAYNKTDDTDYAKAMMGTYIYRPIIVLLIAYVAHLYI